MTTHAGSRNDWLSSFSVGERRYVDTTLAEFSAVMRAASTRSRFPEHMKTWRFATGLFTAVAAASAADVRYLVSVERVK
jgi:hypothetical protein